jgi:ketopantoate hydroxymethyltransferase
LDIQKNNINFKIQTKIKKVFFSAVTLVAFSFAGMANESEVKKVKVEDQKESVVSNKTEIQEHKVEEAIGGASACAQLARNAVLQAANEYNLDISRGGAHFEIMMEMYNLIYEDCYYN